MFAANHTKNIWKVRVSVRCSGAVGSILHLW